MEALTPDDEGITGIGQDGHYDRRYGADSRRLPVPAAIFR